jgi:hypothetical protein
VEEEEEEEGCEMVDITKQGPSVPSCEGDDVDSLIPRDQSTMSSVSLPLATSAVLQVGSEALNREVLLSVAAYGFCCMSFIIIDETAPLMMKLDREHGGLAFSSSRIGSILAVGGLAMLTWTTLFLPLISSRSKLFLFRVAFATSVPMTLLFPFIASSSGYILHALGQELGTRVISAAFVLALTVRGCTSTVMFLAVSLAHPSDPTTHIISHHR